MIRWLAPLGLLALAFSGCLCGNECDFYARCAGNVREQCGEGVDQQVGRKIIRTTCAGANPLCFELDGGDPATYDRAQCVASRRPCDPTAPPVCDDAGLTVCDPLLHVPRVETCRCVASDGGGRCLPGP